MGIAQVAATSGYTVTLQDVIPDQLKCARETIAKSVEKRLARVRSLLNKGCCTEHPYGCSLEDVALPTWSSKLPPRIPKSS